MGRHVGAYMICYSTTQHRW